MSEPNSNSQSVPTSSVGESGLHLHEVASQQPAVSGEAEHPATTTEFVRRAVAEQPPDESARLLLPKDAGMISAETLLAIVSYCYAKGIYSCREIEVAMLQDQELRASFGTNLPSDACLRRFRRLNRTAIETILEKTFVQAKHELGSIPPDHQADPSAKSATAGPKNPADEPGQTVFLARQAAADRLQKALFIDGMTRDP